MANSRLSRQSFPAECPQCRQTTGIVCKAGTVLHQPSVIRLTVRCGTCHHEWLVDAASEQSYVGEALDDTQDGRILYR